MVVDYGEAAFSQLLSIFKPLIILPTQKNVNIYNRKRISKYYPILAGYFLKYASHILQRKQPQVSELLIHKGSCID